MTAGVFALDSDATTVEGASVQDIWERKLQGYIFYDS